MGVRSRVSGRGKVSKRQKITSAALADKLIKETGKALGGSASFLAPHLKVRHRSGEPNWNASVDIFGGALITAAFSKALERAKRLYQLLD